MRYRELPSTGVVASEVGFGTWTLATGWWGEKTDAEAVEMLRRAKDDFGITYYDTSDAYSNGRAERQLADAFRGRRDEVVYATKVGYDIYDEAAVAARRGQQELPQRTDAAFIRRAVEESLKRLETDHIDVLQFHNVKMEQVRDAELWDTFRALKREGKIRAWGAAFGPAIGWRYEAIELCEREPDINAIHMIWNLLEFEPGQSIVDAAKRAAPGCTFQLRVTHSSGMLEGKYTEDTVFPKNDHRRHRPRSWLLNGLKKVETLGFLAREMTLGQAALKWLLAEPRVVSTLPNIYDDEQLVEFAAAADMPDLTAEDLARVTELQARNFGVDEETMRYKGTMDRAGGVTADGATGHETAATERA